MSEEIVPVDLERCQTDRPSTWPDMPSFMTLGPVTWKRCENKPVWIGSDMTSGGSMSLCDECKGVMEKLFSPVEVTVELIGSGTPHGNVSDLEAS